MAKKLLQLTVDKISLVSKDETPAVPAAETEVFAVFKTVKKKKHQRTPEQIKKIDQIYHSLTNHDH